VEAPAEAPAWPTVGNAHGGAVRATLLARRMGGAGSPRPPHRPSMAVIIRVVALRRDLLEKGRQVLHECGAAVMEEKEEEEEEKEEEEEEEEEEDSSSSSSSSCPSCSDAAGASEAMQGVRRD
jgi:hypothetical protein